MPAGKWRQCCVSSDFAEERERELSQVSCDSANLHIANTAKTGDTVQIRTTSKWATPSRSQPDISEVLFFQVG